MPNLGFDKYACSCYVGERYNDSLAATDKWARGIVYIELGIDSDLPISTQLTAPSVDTLSVCKKWSDMAEFSICHSYDDVNIEAKVR